MIDQFDQFETMKFYRSITLINDHCFFFPRLDPSGAEAGRAPSVLYHNRTAKGALRRRRQRFPASWRRLRKSDEGGGRELDAGQTQRAGQLRAGIHRGAAAVRATRQGK